MFVDDIKWWLITQILFIVWQNSRMNINVTEQVRRYVLSVRDRCSVEGVFDVLLSKAGGYPGLAYVDSIMALLSRYHLDPTAIAW